MSNQQDIIRDILNDVRVEVLDEFDKNFERKGFFESKTWQKAKNSDPRGSLMMRTGKLRKSIRAEVTDNSVVFKSSKPYANIHNEGGEIMVTEQMKKFFWAKYYEHSGKVKTTSKGIAKSTQKHNAQAKYYKSLALMKVGSKMTIPKRQFIGDHPQITKHVETIVSKHLETLFKDFLKPKK